MNQRALIISALEKMGPETAKKMSVAAGPENTDAGDRTMMVAIAVVGWIGWGIVAVWAIGQRRESRFWLDQYRRSSKGYREFMYETHRRFVAPTLAGHADATPPTPSPESAIGNGGHTQPDTVDAHPLAPRNQ